MRFLIVKYIHAAGVLFLCRFTFCWKWTVEKLTVLQLKGGGQNCKWDNIARHVLGPPPSLFFSSTYTRACSWLWHLSSCWLKWSWCRVAPFAPLEWMGKKKKTVSRPNLCAFVEPVLQVVCTHNHGHCGLHGPRCPVSVLRAHNCVYLCHALSVNASPFTRVCFYC